MINNEIHIKLCFSVSILHHETKFIHLKADFEIFRGSYICDIRVFEILDEKMILCAPL